MKKIISIIIALAMLLSFAACSEPDIPQVPVDNGEEKSFVLNKNNIKIESKYVGNPNDWGGYNSAYPEISGLKNKNVEANINARIKSEFDRLASWEEYPNYRGLYYDLQKIKDLDPYYEGVYATEFCNVGNVLSVVFDAQKSYESIDDRGYYDSVIFNIRKPINFNLATGEELRISDVFKNGFDGIKYINNEIDRIINNTESSDEGFFYGDGWESFKLVGEFPGITEDQAYYISSYGDTMYIVLDENTPWVYLESHYPFYIPIDISAVSALDDKFIKDDIYEDESSNYILMPNAFDETKTVRESVFDSEYLGQDTNYYEETISYNKDMPEYQIQMMKDFIADQRQTVDEFLNSYLTEDRCCNISLTTGVNRIGKFTNIDFYNYYSVYSDWNNGDQFQQIDYNSNNVVFKEGIERPLVIEDLFISGYDFSTWEFDPHEYDFEVSTDALYFRGHDSFFIKTYEEIGCENLTIFE